MCKINVVDLFEYYEMTKLHLTTDVSLCVGVIMSFLWNHLWFVRSGHHPVHILSVNCFRLRLYFSLSWQRQSSQVLAPSWGEVVPPTHPNVATARLCILCHMID